MQVFYENISQKCIKNNNYFLSSWGFELGCLGFC